jgi:hypothetical protein
MSFLHRLEDQATGSDLAVVVVCSDDEDRPARRSGNRFCCAQRRGICPDTKQSADTDEKVASFYVHG